MAITDRILAQPAYGWADEKGDLLIPTPGQLFREAISRINIFRSVKNWISFIGPVLILCLVLFLYLFISRFFSWKFAIAGLFYSLFIMSIHTTVWLHRYCTHRAFAFRHPFWAFFVRNLVIRTVPEEIYVLSHHVHHARSDRPGDPYNARGGFLYCLLAEFNHQRLAMNLEEGDYELVKRLMRHTGVRLNTYTDYLRWGTVASPGYTLAGWLLNWISWYAIFFLIGGQGLALAIFSGALLWYLMVRNFNYTGHGKGEEKHRKGIEFDNRNLSLNQWRPGILAGEWHNNHHLYPSSARTGFLSYQLDIPWLLIYGMYRLGIVSRYQNARAAFLKKYFNQPRSHQ